MAIAVLLALSLGGLPEPTVQIAFTVAPAIGAPGSPPRLTVEVKNVAGTTIPFMRFDSDACFAHFYLSSKVTTPAGEKEAVPRCAVKDWPGRAGELAAGASERRQLKLGALFSGVNWAKGHYELEVFWETGELTEYEGGKYAARAKSSSMRGSEFALAPLLSSFRIEKGKTFKLPGGARLRFDGHGHKDVVAGGPSSPLIVSGGFAAQGAKTFEEFSTNVHTDEGTGFSVEGHLFDLGKYEYGSWMELRYFGPEN